MDWQDLRKKLREIKTTFDKLYKYIIPDSSTVENQND